MSASVEFQGKVFLFGRGVNNFAIELLCQICSRASENNRKYREHQILSVIPFETVKHNDSLHMESGQHGILFLGSKQGFLFAIHNRRFSIIYSEKAN